MELKRYNRVKYAYLVLVAASFLAGGYLSHKLFPRTELREVPVTVTKTQTVTKEVIRQADGTVTERVVTQTKDHVKASPQPPKPQYRVGALIRPDLKPELSDVKVSASRRLAGSVWADAQYDVKRKEVLVGISLEF